MQIIRFLTISLLFIFASVALVQAQFRSDVPSGLDWTGPVTKPQSQAVSGLLGLQDFRMDHSYEMSVGSFGGATYNQNFYTNTMHFLFNQNLYGRVDLSLAHSPFGNSMMAGDENVQFFVRNAELNYRFSENSHIRLSFSQLPRGYGFYSPFHNPHYHSGFMGRSHQRHFPEW